MKSHQAYLWNVVGMVMVAALFAAVATAILLPASAEAAERGTVTICKAIVDEDGDAVSDGDRLPNSSFFVSLYKVDDDGGTSTVDTVDFDARGFAPNESLFGSRNDAQCIDYFVDFGEYFIGEEELTDDDEWLSPRYHISSDGPADDVSDLDRYEDDAFEVSEEDSEWTITVLNRVGGEDDENEDDENGSVNESSLRISDLRVRTEDDGSIIVTWETNRRASSQVVYGTRSVSTSDVRGSDEDDNYGYESATAVTNRNGTRTHRVVISGLEADTYYVRPVSDEDGDVTVGRESRILVRNDSGSAPLFNPAEYITTHLGIGASNAPAEIIKLQVFLRVYGGYDVDLSGVYDQKTFDAVSRFQERFAGEVLAPWGYARPTGHVYILTKNKINEIVSGREIGLTAAEQAEIQAFRARGAAVPPRGSATGGTGSQVSTPGSVVTPPAAVPGTSTVAGPETGATSTATGTPELEKGVLGNLAGAVFSLPENGTEATRCIFNLVIILAIIYIITSILISNDETPNMTRTKIRTRKLAFFLAGTIIATAFALFFDMFCLVLPLLVALVVLVILLVVNKTKDRGTTGTGSTGGSAGTPPTAPLIVEQSKASVPPASTPTPTA